MSVKVVAAVTLTSWYGPSADWLRYTLYPSAPVDASHVTRTSVQLKACAFTFVGDGGTGTAGKVVAASIIVFPCSFIIVLLSLRPNKVSITVYVPMAHLVIDKKAPSIRIKTVVFDTET